MGKGIRSEAEKKANSFTKEVLGMATVLFSLLVFLCLITGDAVFYTLGAAVQRFFVGVFGYYSFIFIIYTTLLGIRLIAGRALFAKRTRKAFFFLSVFLFGLFEILHLALFSGARTEFATFVSGAYSSVGGGFVGSTPFGAFGSLLAFPILKLASEIGAYVIYSLIAIVSLVYLLKKPISNAIAAKGKRSANKPVKVKKQPILKTNENSAEADNYSTNEKPTNKASQREAFMINNYEAAESEKPATLFVANADFRVKTKKELKYTTEIAPLEGEFFADSAERGGVTAGRYSKMVDSDFAEKLEYVKKPPKVNLDNIGQSPTRVGSVSSPLSQKPVEKPSTYDASSLSKRVYTVDTSTKPNRQFSNEDAPISESYDRPQTRREGYFDAAKPNYNAPNFPQGQAFSDSNQDRQPQKPADRFSRYDFAANQRINSEATRSDALNREDSFKKEQEGFNEEKRLGREAAFSNEKANSYEPNASKAREYFSANESKKAEGFSRGASFNNENKNLDSQSLEANNINGINLIDPLAEGGGSSPIGGTAKSYAPVSSERNGYDHRPQSRGYNANLDAPPAQVALPKLEPYEEEDDGSEVIDNMPLNYRYKAPPLTLLNEYRRNEEAVLADREQQNKRANTILEMLKIKSINASLERIIYGPTVTRFEISIPREVPIRSVLSAQADLQMWLEAKGEIRIIAPIPETSKIGIEVPNNAITTVGLKDVLNSKEYKQLPTNKGIFFALGKDVVGKPILLDIMEMPHLLVAGATGTGKSVCLNTMLISLMYRYSPEELRIIIIDPKIVEFVAYKGIPHLVFNEIIGIDNRAISTLEWVVNEMERRYKRFADRRVKKLSEYNAQVDPSLEHKLPYLIVLVDEFAELMATAQSKKKIDNLIGRLAQKARGAGISLIFATQRPSADIIEGSIKTNFTSRICFKTASSVDSQVVIGKPGSEKLLGKGDVLYQTTTSMNIERAQGAFIDNSEVLDVIEYIKTKNKCFYDKEALRLINRAAVDADHDSDSDTNGRSDSDRSANPDEVEDVYKRALRVAIMTRNISKTSLQSKLSIGYPKAAKIIDWMEMEGFVSSTIDNKSREIYITREEYERRFGEFEENYR